MCLSISFDDHFKAIFVAKFNFNGILFHSVLSVLRAEHPHLLEDSGVVAIAERGSTRFLHAASVPIARPNTPQRNVSNVDLRVR